MTAEPLDSTLPVKTRTDNSGSIDEKRAPRPISCGPISVIIPTLNESANIAHLLIQLDQTLMQADITYEAIVVDGGHGGNEARFINHSCDPNCEAVVVNGHIYIQAIKTIQPGVELTYDYRLTRPGRRRAIWKQLYACHCGAPNCRGTMLERPTPQKKKR